MNCELEVPTPPQSFTHHKSKKASIIMVVRKNDWDNDTWNLELFV